MRKIVDIMATDKATRPAYKILDFAVTKKALLALGKPNFDSNARHL